MDDVDTTHAGAGTPLGDAVLDRAKDALGKLAALSAASKKALTRDEIKAKSVAFDALMRFDGQDNVLEDEQIDFLVSFARELKDHFTMSAEDDHENDHAGEA